MADKLMALCVIESIDPSQERFDPTLGSCYVLRVRCIHGHGHLNGNDLTVIMLEIDPALKLSVNLDGCDRPV